MTTALISAERRGAVHILTLNRPERLNALPDLEDGDAFAAVCEAINADRPCAASSSRGRAGRFRRAATSGP